MNESNVPLNSPVFQPRPGWGGQLKSWAGNHRRLLLAVAGLVIAGVVVSALFNNGTEITEATPTPTPDGGAVAVQAQYGDSITTLARRALQMYILSHTQSVDLTDVQEVYVETLLKNEMGEQRLSIGQTLTFPHTTIEHAIEASKNMTDFQIRYYSRFVQ